MKKSLRIAINAQIPSGSGAGGIETVLRVLTSLNRFDSGEEYVFIGHWSDADWLEHLLGERQTLVRAPRPEKQYKPDRAEKLKRLTGIFRPLARSIKNIVLPARQSDIPKTPRIPVSDGFYERLNCDVIHFPYQDYVYCSGVPTIYNPHDLQHRHFPEFFAPQEIERREIIYPAACRAARAIVAASQFVKEDIIRCYRTEAEKIQVIPWSPPEIETKEFSEKDARNLFEKYDCPPRPFILYPAMTWEHKNHLRLLEAVHLLRERDGLRINVICTGHRNDFFPQIEKRLRELNLEKQIQFTGIVEYKELSMFYRAAQMVVVPTLFEAASAPLFEAWQHGVPVACSAVTSLPEQAGNAARLFNPFSIEEIAAAVKELALDENLRSEYRERGYRRLRDFDLGRTAKTYRALFRKTAGTVLSEEDEDLLGIRRANSVKKICESDK